MHTGIHVYLCVYIYGYRHVYLNIHQHFHMLKKLYTLNKDFKNLDTISGPGLKSVNFINSVPTIVFLGCFSLCILPCGREHKTQPKHLTCYFKYEAYRGMGLMEFLRGVAFAECLCSYMKHQQCARGASLEFNRQI